MEPSCALDRLQAQMSYQFKNLSLLEKTLVAGDTNSDDREGHRGMAQLGDSLMAMVIISDGLERGLPRRELQDACSDICSKKFCGRIAKGLRLQDLIKISVRQVHAGIQLTTLKNAVAALVGAVWLDSHNYGAVLQVMISIGLLNHAQYHDQLQDTLLMDADPEFIEFAPLATETASGGESRFDGDYWSLLSEENCSLDDLFLFQPQSNHVLSPIAELASTTSTVGTPDYTPPSSPVSMKTGERHERQGRQESLAASASSDRSKALAKPNCSAQDRAGEVRRGLGGQSPETRRRLDDLRATRHDARKRTGKKTGRPRAQSITCNIAAYIDDERRKNITSHGLHCTINAFEAYRLAIIQAPSKSQQSLFVLATSIGDSSALPLLKEAIQGLRSPRVGDSLCVDRPMSISERITIIERFGCCTALWKVIRWLHIVTLWEDLSQRAGDGADRFVLATPESLTQYIPRKGNPRFLARSEVAKGLSDIQSSQHGDSECNEQYQNTRLRRLGERLGLVTRKWGPGTLLILGQALSDTNITTPTQLSFETLIALIDHHEGARISAVSAAAHSIVQDFRQAKQTAARLRLESADEDSILNVSRLSTDFEVLLGRLDE